jgi:hypothetical protein
VKWSIHFKNGQKNSINFSIIKNGPFRLFFQRSAYLWTPTILILVSTFGKISKKDPHILEKVKKIPYLFKIYGSFLLILQNVGTKIKIVRSTNKHSVEKNRRN